MKRSETMHKILLVAYGAAVGCGYVVLLYFIFPRNRLVVLPLSLILPVLLALMGLRFAREFGMERRSLVLMPLIPIVFPAMIALVGIFLLCLAAFSPIAMARWLKEERRFRKEMKSKGRFLHLVELGSKLKAGEGTLIEETGHKGPYHIWWTEDDVLAKGTPAATQEDFLAIYRGEGHAFNSLCLKEYLDRDTGKAFLTEISPRYARSGKLARMYPQLPVAMVVVVKK